MEKCPESSFSLLSEGPARALLRDAIKDSTEFTSIQTPFKDDDSTEHEHKDKYFCFLSERILFIITRNLLFYSNLEFLSEIFNDRITVMPDAWINEYR